MRKKSILIILLLFLSGAGASLAAPNSSKPQPAKSDTSVSKAQQRNPASKSEQKEPSLAGLSRRVSLDLRGMDIIDTIKFLSMKGDLNIVTSKNVTGRITLFLKNVTIGDILDVILLTNDLAMQKKDNIITIMTDAEYEQLYGKKYFDKREVRTIKLKYTLPSRVGKVLDSIKSSIGKIIMDDETGTLVLIDTPEKIREMEETASEFDIGLLEKKPRTVSQVFELKYAKAADIKPKVSASLTPKLGSVQIDERTNKIIVRDLPYKIKEIGEMISAFDSKPREVVIEAKIVELTLNNNFAFGVDWDKLLKKTKDIMFEGSFPFNAPTGIAGNFGKISIGTWKPGFYTDEGTQNEAFHQGGLDARRSGELLTFLKSIGKVKIISSPHIAVVNNGEAKIMVGTRQPYATSTISQGDVTSTTSWNAEFVDLGVTLSVTPTINKDGFVKMHIKPEVSTLRDWFEVQDKSGTTQIKLPQVDTSNAETDVLVKDGTTVVIAGLIKNTEYKNKRRVPFLGNIPVVGSLLGSTSTGVETKELVIFLTPRIITGEENLFFIRGTEKLRKPEKYIRWDGLRGEKPRKPEKDINIKGNERLKKPEEYIRWDRGWNEKPRKPEKE